MKSPNDSADIHDSPRKEPRLPPGQILTEKWPVLHYGAVPRVDLAQWSFRIHGRVTAPAQWTWEEFQELPRTRLRSDNVSGGR